MSLRNIKMAPNIQQNKSLSINLSQYICFETKSKMLQQFKILLLSLIFHIVLSNYEGYEIDSTTSHEMCTEADETVSDSNCYCYR